MSESSIEWTTRTWNPVTGCDKVSAGCKFCYAERLSGRLKAMGLKKYENGFDVTLHAESLDEPFTWKKPQVVFVCSMSDLFHDDVPEHFIKRIFKAINDTPQHTYQILTKRPERALRLAKSINWTKNIWLGTSIEDNRVLDRLNILKKIPAKTRFLSLEPLIGPLQNLSLKGVRWVIVGGESGPGARPIREEWVLNLKSQCKTYSIPFFFKQWGMAKYNPNPEDPTIEKSNENHAKGGCMLRGRIYRQMPTVRKESGKC